MVQTILLMSSPNSSELSSSSQLARLSICLSCHQLSTSQIRPTITTAGIQAQGEQAGVELEVKQGLHKATTMKKAKNGGQGGPKPCQFADPSEQGVLACERGNVPATWRSLRNNYDDGYNSVTPLRLRHDAPYEHAEIM
jgi:hypothetical protein